MLLINVLLLKKLVTSYFKRKLETLLIYSLFQTCQHSNCCRKPPGVERFHLFSKAYSFDILNYSDNKKSQKYCRIVEYWIEHYKSDDPIREFFIISYYDLFNKYNFKMAATQIRGDEEAIIQAENTDNKVAKTSS